MKQSWQIRDAGDVRVSLVDDGEGKHSFSFFDGDGDYLVGIAGVTDIDFGYGSHRIGLSRLRDVAWALAHAEKREGAA